MSALGPIKRRRSATKGTPGRSERGVAMLLVLVGLAVLALVANEVRYNSVVELRLAANARDDVRAHFLAKSGIAMSRLILRFQKQVDSIQLPNLGGMLQGLMGGGANGAAGGPLASLLPMLASSGLNPTMLGSLIPGMGGSTPGAMPGGVPGMPGGGAPSGLSIQLWRMAKVDCHLLSAMIPEEPAKVGGIGPASVDRHFKFDEEFSDLGKAQTNRKFGDFDGCFDSVITDEEERINLSKLDAPQLTSSILLGQLVAAFSDKKYEFLFEKEDSNKVKVAPTDLIIALRDWIDEDETGSTLNLSGQGEPFQKGFADENGNYDKYDPRYRAKNARFDSLDELYMVHGVNDRFMAAFRDRLTVFPDINSKLNINSDDPVLLELAIRSVLDPTRPDPRLADPIFIDTLIQKIRAARMFALFGMSAIDFVNVLAQAGLAVNPTIMNNPQNQRFIGDKSTTYRISVTGTAGEVSRVITAVVRLDDQLGRLVYWREE